MPVIKSAKKKLRKDKKRTLKNRQTEENVKKLIKAAKKQKSVKAIQSAIQATDKAAKIHIFHKNKAARIKSTLSQLATTSSTKKGKATK